MNVWKYHHGSTVLIILLQFAKTDHSRIKVGSDGIVYKMVDSREWDRYQIMTDEAVANEARRSREVKENMLLLSGKLKHGEHHIRSPKRGIGTKFVPPQLGTTSRTRKIEQKAWHNELQTAMLHGKTNPPSGRTSFNQTISSLVENAVYNHEQEELPESPIFDYTTNIQQDKVSKAFNVIKQKYEQNLHVVEKLYSEKTSLEDYTQTLEEQLMTLTGARSAKELHVILSDRKQAELVQGMRDEHLPVTDHHIETDDDEKKDSPFSKPSTSSYDPRVVRSNRPPRPSSARPHGGSYTAAEFADMFNDGGQHSSGTESPHGTRLGRSAARSMPSSLRSSSAPKHLVRQSSPGLPVRSTSADARHSRTAPSSRSASATRRSVDGISANLQADADRYVQKRRLIEEKERLERLEHEKYLLELEERRLRASRYGHEFEDMTKRTKDMEKKRQSKEDEMKRKEVEERRRQLRERKKASIEKENAMIAAFRGKMSWKDIKENEEAQRRERIEKRKTELQLEAALPKSIEENLTKSKQKEATAAAIAQQEAIIQKRKSSFKAEDPLQVRERLQRKQQEWNERIQDEKLKLKTQYDDSRRSHGFIITEDGKTLLPKSALELRYEEYKRKNMEKKKEEEDKAREEAEKKKDEERRKREKILMAKIPDASKKTTKKAELHRAIIQKKFEDEEMQRKMDLAKQKKKELALKEAGAALSVIVKEEDMRLKSGNPSYLELSKTEQLAEEKAKQAREEYRQKLRENKRKLQESLKNRPSLIERHEKNIATRDASAAALKKIAHVAVASNNNKGTEDGKDSDGDYSDDDNDWLKGKDLGKGKSKPSGGVKVKGKETELLDDILDPKEKIMLGVK